MRRDSPQALLRGPTRAFCCAALGLGLAFASYSQGVAQDKAQDKAREAESPPPLSATVYEVLKNAREQMEEARPAAAHDALRELLDDAQSLHAYETALVQQALGYALAALGQATAAARNFQKSLASGQLPEAVNQELRLRAGLAFLQAELRLEGVALLEQWLTTEPQPALAPRLALALAYHHLGRRESLLPLLEQALREDPPQREDWLLLLLSTRLKHAEHREALPVLQELLALRPDKRDYWLLLVASQEALGRATAALATHELAYQQGVLQADDLLHLAHRYLERHRPYAAARLLRQEGGKFAPHQRAMLELEGEAWRLAHDPAAAIQAWQTLLQQTPDKLVIGLRARPPVPETGTLGGSPGIAR